MRTRRLILSGLVPLTLAIASCGGSGTAGISTGTGGQGGSPSGPNVATITVDAGPSANGHTINSVDVPYITVTICDPGSTTRCQTFDHIEVDTGSYGFRILADATDNSGNPLNLGLPAEASSGGDTIAECAQFVDGYSWGPLTTADIQISGELAASVPIQVIGDPTVSGDSGFPAVPPNCSSTGTNEDSVSTFGANGILGVGPFTHDCGSGCVATYNGFYYACPSSGGCVETGVSDSQQVTNPVADFQTDNNGVIVELPSISSNGAVTTTGWLVFGIGTEGNNSLSGHTVLMANVYGDVTTQFNGQSLPYSVFDTGSNGYYFNDSSIATCTSPYSGWFCPTSTVSLNATNYGVNSNGTQTGAMSSVTIHVGNARTLFSNNYSAYNDIGGSSGDQSAYCPNSSSNCSFDFGLPFFFGRAVFVAINGANTSGGAGPYFAY